jgi:hypothetical protein
MLFNNYARVEMVYSDRHTYYRRELVTTVKSFTALARRLFVIGLLATILFDRYLSGIAEDRKDENRSY